MVKTDSVNRDFEIFISKRTRIPKAMKVIAIMGDIGLNLDEKAVS
jgi:hypothetical protein